MRVLAQQSLGSHFRTVTVHPLLQSRCNSRSLLPLVLLLLGLLPPHQGHPVEDWLPPIFLDFFFFFTFKIGREV